ncbi:MAG TPA: KpsF/GutQ family sugar-phosphate isomerase [Sphingomicrobium sp.]|nr:KpsF/GutQ family sugar-phosphate isomerase [Sphingomicrobium sp.]
MTLPDADASILEFGRTMVHDEARALDALADSLGAEFEAACRLILDSKGKLIVAGLGKSGHIGRKIAATFASTGTTAIFLHLAEAIHGDLGIADGGDVALLISQSGQTAELQPVIDHFDAIGVPIIAITGNAGSMLGLAAAASLVLPHWPEVGPEAVAPTTSTTMTLALGDALAMTVMREKGFTRTDFGRIHPGGTLGFRLRPVKRVMHGGDKLPLVTADTSMHDTIVVMTEKRLGVVGVTDADGRLIGIITDGDLRRNIERGLDHPASAYMNANPKAVAPDALVDEALTLFEEHRITTLFVIEDGRPVGVVHLHDTPTTR